MHAIVLDVRMFLIDDVVDLADTVARVRRDLARDGCSVVPDFVRPAFREALRDEGATAAPSAYYDVETVNVYNSAPDATLPRDHPAHRTTERGNAFVARDALPDGAIIERLYTDPRFQRFVADCFGLAQVHPLADPLSGLVLNVVSPGRGHPWHFDTNEFTVSMVTQEPDGGGVFEYCPNIRSPRMENVDDVCAALDGRYPARRVTLRAGELQLFAGRYSLHRVTTVTGATERHSAIFAFSERPGVVGTAARTRQLFGRVTRAHRVAEARVRVDRLMD